jgi:LysM repeat protein
MKLSQYTVVFLLGAAIATGAIYFGYRVIYPYRHLRSITPARYVHPLAKQIEKAKELRTEGKLQDAQKLLREQLRLYPNALQAQAARDLLGEINTQMFFSTDNLFGKTEYVVKRGDSLWRIARKLDSTPAIIKRANELQSDLIHPGDQLLIPDNDFTVTLDLPNQRVVVHHGDGFFKQYPIVDINLTLSPEAQLASKVTSTTFWKNGALISCDAEEARANSDPRIHLGRGGYILYGVAEDSGVSDSTVEVSEPPNEAARNSDVSPHGIALLKDDLAELQLLIRRGTPVTIIRTKP